MSNLPESSPSSESNELMRVPAGGELVRLAESGLGLVKEVISEGQEKFWASKINSCQASTDAFTTLYWWENLPQLQFYLTKLISIKPESAWAFALRGLVKAHILCGSQFISCKTCEYKDIHFYINNFHVYFGEMPCQQALSKASVSEFTTILSDLSSAINIDPKSIYYLNRAKIKVVIGDSFSALQDYYNVIKTDNSYLWLTQQAYEQCAQIKRDSGDEAGANGDMLKAKQAESEWLKYESEILEIKFRDWSLG